MKKTKNGTLAMSDGESFYQWLAKERDDGRITRAEWAQQLKEHRARVVEIQL